MLLRPLPYSDAERLVVLNHRDQRTGITKEFIAIGDFVDPGDRQSAFDAFGGYGTGQATIFGENEPYQVNALQATSGVFQALGVRPLLGRGLETADSRPGAGPVMLLGYELWQGRFGSDSSVVGRTVRIGNGERLVVGVAPPRFRFPPNDRTDVIVSMTVPVQAPQERKSGWAFAVARLKANSSLQDAIADLSVVSRQLESEFPQSNGAAFYG